jgi:hypothetical protein
VSLSSDYARSAFLPVARIVEVKPLMPDTPDESLPSRFEIETRTLALRGAAEGAIAKLLAEAMLGALVANGVLPGEAAVELAEWCASLASRTAPSLPADIGAAVTAAATDMLDQTRAMGATQRARTMN